MNPIIDTAWAMLRARYDQMGHLHAIIPWGDRAIAVTTDGIYEVREDPELGFTICMVLSR